MLDLSPNSPLAAHQSLIRKHNATLLASVEESPVLARAIADRDEWTYFC